jgi:hypothetical protein
LRNLLFYSFVAVLLLGGAGLTVYKSKVVGFPLRPGQQTDVWEIEAAVRFDANGEPVKASFAIPTDPVGYRLLDETFVSGRFGLQLEGSAERRAIWTDRDPAGHQAIFYRIAVFRGVGTYETSANDADEASLPNGEARGMELFEPYFTDSDRVAAEAAVEAIWQRSADALSFTGLLLNELGSPPRNGNIEALLGRNMSRSTRAQVARDLLSLRGIPSRFVRGLSLDGDARRADFLVLLEVHDGERWTLFDLDTGQPGIPVDFFVWQRGGVSLLDIEGGTNSEVTFSVTRSSLPTDVLARARTAEVGDPLIDFSLYALPLEEQAVFRLLLLIPIGALVLVLLRNLVGISTSGTFMPILIALAFQETRVLPGLLLFVLVVGAGLLMRSWLSRLNLLLVPRISAVVVMVILIMATLSVLSHKLGLEQGLTVTFFPTIILAWTIERLSIHWEETGPREAISLGAGSLFVAICAHLAMDMVLVKHLTFAFPELLLCVLGLILLVGQYSGYRLLELHRFRNFKD